jgi:hypothetical protein
MSKGVPGVKHYASKMVKCYADGGPVVDEDVNESSVEPVPAVSKTARGARLEVAHRNWNEDRARDRRDKKRDD